MKEKLETSKSNLLDFDKKCNNKGNFIVKLVFVNTLNVWFIDYFKKIFALSATTLEIFFLGNEF